MKAALEAAAKTALDERRPLPDRVAAVALWKGAPFDELAAVAEQLLDPRQPLDVQLAAVEALAGAEDGRAADLLLRDWLSKTPKLQTAVLGRDLPTAEPAGKTVGRPAAGRGAAVQPGHGSPRATAGESRCGDPPPVARQLLAAQGVTKDRQEVLARYTDALALPRDAVRGQAVFQRQCAKCHRVKEQGFLVGPDLANTIQRTDEMLVSDVLDPSNQITAGYNSYTAVTEDGRIYSGVLAAESATHVTLRREEGKEDTILRKDIEEMAASRTSLMPEKVEQEIKPQEMVDLIAYLRQAFGPQLPAAGDVVRRRSRFRRPARSRRRPRDPGDRGPLCRPGVPAHGAAAALVAADSRLAVPDRRAPGAGRIPVSAVRLEVVRRSGRDDRTGSATAIGRPRTSRSGGTTAARTPRAGRRVRSRPTPRSNGSKSPATCGRISAPSR